VQATFIISSSVLSTLALIRSFIPLEYAEFLAMTEEAPIDPSSADFSVVEGGDPVNVVKTTLERDAAKQHCCSWTRFGGVRMAQGYCIVSLSPHHAACLVGGRDD
jgi:hypothetical protein